MAGETFPDRIRFEKKLWGKGTLDTNVPLRAAAIQQFLALVDAAPVIAKLEKVPAAKINDKLQTITKDELWKAGSLYEETEHRQLTKEDFKDLGHIAAFLHKNGLRFGDMYQRNVIATEHGSKLIDFETANLQGEPRTLIRLRKEDSSQISLLNELEVNKWGWKKQEDVAEDLNWLLRSNKRIEKDMEKEKSERLSEIANSFNGKEWEKYITFLPQNKRDIKTEDPEEYKKELRKRIEEHVHEMAAKNTRDAIELHRAAADAYAEEIQDEPLNFKGKSIFDYKKEPFAPPFVRDIKK